MLIPAGDWDSNALHDRTGALVKLFSLANLGSGEERTGLFEILDYEPSVRRGLRKADGSVEEKDRKNFPHRNILMRNAIFDATRNRILILCF